MSLQGLPAGIIVVLCSSFAVAYAQTETDRLRMDAQAALEKGDYSRCAELTNQLLAGNPKDHVALYLRASSNVELGAARSDANLVRQGIQDARSALETGGTNEINYYLPYLHGMTILATLDTKREHADTVIKYAQSVLARSNLTPEQRANLLFQRANAYIFLGKFHSQYPDQVKDSQRNFELANQDFQAAVQAYPKHLGALVGLAESYVVAGKQDKALATFTSAIEQYPQNPLVYNNRGLFHSQHGRSKEAIADFNKALQLDPRFTIAIINRGFTHAGERNLTAAESDYSEAIRMEPNNPLAYRLRGTCRLSQLNANGAIEDYAQAIRLDQQNAVAYADLGFAKFFAHDYAGAQTALDQSVAMHPQMRYLNPWRIWTLVMESKADGIANIVDASAKRKDPDWIDELVLFVAGKISEQDLVKFIDKTTDPNFKNAQLCEAYFFIGERRLQSGDKSNAILFFESSIKQNMTDLSAHRGSMFQLRAQGLK